MALKTNTLMLLFAIMIAVPNPAQTQQPKPSERTPQKARLPADPFHLFRYRISESGQGQYFAGFSKVSVKGSAASGGYDPRGSNRGRDKYEAITLERGVTQDPSFAHWASQGRQIRDLFIDGFDEAGHKNSTMRLVQCTVTQYQSVPDLLGPANRVTIQVATLQCQSLTRR